MVGCLQEDFWRLVDRGEVMGLTLKRGREAS